MSEQIVRHRHGYKVKPFEWLYEGLQPLLLPDVLARKWGIPLALSIVYTCLGLRLGVALVPQKVRLSPGGLPSQMSYNKTKPAAMANALWQ